MINKPVFGIKVDVDTERGTRIGVPNLVALFKELGIPATFYLSLGPDNTGRAMQRVFRRGFLQKVGRTSVVSTYGVRTLLNGVLWPGPHIGKRHAVLLQQLSAQGFEVGIHAYDHQRWQDNVMQMSVTEVSAEFGKAVDAFSNIFNQPCKTAAAPGWQANANTLATYAQFGLIYASDCRGHCPFYPQVAAQKFSVLQIPTTLPTLDELLGRSEFPFEKLHSYFLSLLTGQLQVMTVHAELEGMKYLSWFRGLLLQLKAAGVTFENLGGIAGALDPATIPTCEFMQGAVDGRSGVLAVQGVRKL